MSARKKAKADVAEPVAAPAGPDTGVVQPIPSATDILSGDAEAEKVRAVMRMNQWIELVEEGGRRHVGTYLYVPDQYKGWNFVRCGLKTSPRAVALAQELVQMGYTKAPACVRCAGFERDGDGAIYLMAPPEVHDKITEYKRRQRRKRDALLSDTLGGGTSGLESMRGVSVTKHEHTTKQMSAEEFRRLGRS